MARPVQHQPRPAQRSRVRELRVGDEPCVPQDRGHHPRPGGPHRPPDRRPARAREGFDDAGPLPRTADGRRSTALPPRRWTRLTAWRARTTQTTFPVRKRYDDLEEDPATMRWPESVAPPTGLEPVTLRLQIHCCRRCSSTAESCSDLRRRGSRGPSSLSLLRIVRVDYPGVSRDSVYPRPMARPPMSLGTSGVIRTYRTRVGWRARTTYRDFDGVTREVQRHGRTEAMAKRALAEALRDRARYDGSAEIRPDMRVVALAETWFQSMQDGDRSATTLAQYRYRLDHQVIPALGELRVRELTAGTLDRHLTAIGKKHGAATAKTVRTVLSGMCGLAARHDALERNPVRDAGQIKNGAKKAPRALTGAEARQLLALLTYDDKAVRRDLPDLVAFMVSTGCRVGEACAIRWSDVDFDRHLVAITGTVTRVNGTGLTVSRTKSAASNRLLRLPEWLLEMLRIRMSRFPQSDDPVFPASLGGLRDPSNTQADLREAFAAAGFGYITSHALRKTAATLLDAAGLSAREIADQLGHSKPSLTQDVYMGRKVASTRAANVFEALG